MAEKSAKRNYWALAGILLGIVSTFVIGRTPLVPLIPAATLVISIAGIFEARKTEDGFAYAIVGFILGLFVLIYYFFFEG
jgi:hypothetical protein